MDKGPLKETIYTSDSSIRNMGDMIFSLRSDFKIAVSLGWRLFIRNFKGQFRQSLLGFTWAVVPPLLTALVWVFLNGQKIVNIDQPSVPYPIFVLTSTLLWSLFAQSVTIPLQVMTAGKSMIIKLNFPKESLLFSGLFQVGIDMVIKVILLVIVFVIFQFTPAISSMYAISGFILLILLGFSIGLLLLPAGMLYQDIQRGLQAILPFWMLLTPVIYPNPRGGLGMLINKYNPVSPILSTTRDWIFGNKPAFIPEMLIISVLVLVFLVIGIFIFRISMPFIIERSGN